MARGFSALALSYVVCDRIPHLSTGKILLMRGYLYLDKGSILLSVPPLPTISSSKSGPAQSLFQFRSVFGRMDVLHCHSDKFQARVPVVPNRRLVDVKELKGVRITHPHWLRILLKNQSIPHAHEGVLNATENRIQLRVCSGAGLHDGVARWIIRAGEQVGRIISDSTAERGSTLAHRLNCR